MVGWFPKGLLSLTVAPVAAADTCWQYHRALSHQDVTRSL